MGRKAGGGIDNRTEIGDAMEYKYGMIFRPPQFGGLPRGLDYTWDADYKDVSRRIRHGVITCTRELTEKEIYDFELIDMN